MKKVSIIVPVYQDEKSIIRCMHSLVNQTWGNIELIVIDDGSTDNSLKKLKEFSENRNNIILIHQRNMGVSSARNKGLKFASGEYITFVDADDFIEKNYIQILVETIQQQKTDLVIDPILLSSKHSFESKSENLRVCNYEMRGLGKAFPYLYSKYIFHNVCGKLYKAYFAKKVLFKKNIKIGEDLLYNLDYLKLIRNMTLINENGYSYIENKNSATHNYRENDFENQKLLNEKSISFYKNILNGKANEISIIEQVFTINVTILILTVISSKELDNYRKKLILKKIYYNPYFYTKLKFNSTNKKTLELTRKIFLFGNFYVLLFFGEIYKLSKKILNR